MHRSIDPARAYTHLFVSICLNKVSSISELLKEILSGPQIGPHCLRTNETCDFCWFIAGDNDFFPKAI